MPQLFLDCDGVLADFDGYYQEVFGENPAQVEESLGAAKLWADLRGHGNFYYRLPLLSDAVELYEAVKHLEPIILTGRPQGAKWAIQQKLQWTARYFPGVRTIVCLSRNKKDHMHHKGDVLVDDRLKYAHHWTDAGGVFVRHVSTAATLEELKRLGVL